MVEFHNIVNFKCIFSEEINSGNKILNLSPDYLLEKYYRIIGSSCKPIEVVYSNEQDEYINDFCDFWKYKRDILVGNILCFINIRHNNFLHLLNDFEKYFGDSNNVQKHKTDYMLHPVLLSLVKQLNIEEKRSYKIMSIIKKLE